MNEPLPPLEAGPETDDASLRKLLHGYLTLGLSPVEASLLEGHIADGIEEIILQFRTFSERLLATMFPLNAPQIVHYRQRFAGAVTTTRGTEEMLDLCQRHLACSLQVLKAEMENILFCSGPNAILSCVMNNFIMYVFGSEVRDEMLQEGDDGYAEYRQRADERLRRTYGENGNDCSDFKKTKTPLEFDADIALALRQEGIMREIIVSMYAGGEGNRVACFHLLLPAFQRLLKMGYENMDFR